MIVYLESYKVPGLPVCGIEIKQGTTGTSYQLWYGGCGIGDAKDLTEAREKLLEEIIGVLIKDRETAEKTLDRVKETVRRLRVNLDSESMGADTHYMAQFLDTPI